MDSRERVLRALKRLPELRDKVPVPFDLRRQLAYHFGKEMGIPVKLYRKPIRGRYPVQKKSYLDI